MTAGSGIRHSEANPSDRDEVHFYQIWIQPEKRGLTPSYEQKTFSDEEKNGKLRVIASRDGKDGSVKINQDASLYVSLLKSGEEVEHAFAQKRHGWLQVARGSVTLAGHTLRAGDGAAISDEQKLAIKANDHRDVLLFDLA